MRQIFMLISTNKNILRIRAGFKCRLLATTYYANLTSIVQKSHLSR